MSYLLSVVVPTKNRYFYLKHLIALIDSFNSEDIELVIQDNSDNNTEILDFLALTERNHLKYFYSNEKLTMSGNSDLAVLHSTGQYVCFIGDDDGVLRNIVDCVKWMKDNDVDVVKPSGANYLWHGYDKGNFRTDMSETAYCKLPQMTFKYSDPIEELKNIMRKGFEFKGTFPVPMLYNGIVRRTTLQDIYDLGKTHFPGASPDLSNGVCLCFFAKKFAVVNLPVVITGTSKFTGGGIENASGITPLNEVPFISQDVIDNWENNIPALWCGRFAWTDSGIKALRYVKRTDFIPYFNHDYSYALFVIYYHKFILAYKFTPNKLFFLYYLITLFIKKTFGFLSRRIINLNRTIIKHGIKDIGESEKFFMEQLSGIEFKNLKELTK